MKHKLTYYLITLLAFTISLKAQITIDGAFADWSGISVLATDATGDGSGGWDIYRLYVTDDANNVYVRVEMATGNGTAETDLFISVDPNTEPGTRTGLSYGWWDNGYDFLVQYNSDYTHLHVHTGSDDGYTFTDLGANTAPFAWDGGKTNVEISMSKSLLDNPNISGWVQNSQTQIAVMTIANGTSGDVLTRSGSNWGGFVYTLNSALPVELTSFTAASTSSATVVLNWQTATEVNNYGFEIERAVTSTSSVTEWEKVGFVAGHGNSNSPKDYTFTDNLLNLNLSLNLKYRLKQIDTDGNYQYSDEISVELSELLKEYKLEQNYPNPFNPSTEISFSIPQAGNVKLTVFNSIGQEVATLMNQQMEQGNHKVKFDASNLTSGIYFYKLESGNFVSVKKMMLLK